MTVLNRLFSELKFEIVVSENESDVKLWPLWPVIIISLTISLARIYLTEPCLSAIRHTHHVSMAAMLTDSASLDLCHHGGKLG